MYIMYLCKYVYMCIYVNMYIYIYSIYIYMCICMNVYILYIYTPILLWADREN